MSAVYVVVQLMMRLSVQDSGFNADVIFQPQIRIHPPDGYPDSDDKKIVYLGIKKLS